MSIDDFTADVPVRAPSSIAWSGYQTKVFDDAAHGDGHTIVEARAGSGKSTTIVEAAARTGTDVLITAFNTRITDDLKAKARSGADVRGLNSYGFGALMRGVGKLEVDKDRAHKLARDLYNNAPGTYERRRAVVQGVRFAKALLASTPDEVNAVADAYGVDVPHTNRAEYARDVLAVMEAAKDLKGRTIDFDDQVWLPVVLGLKGKAYSRVFVDESQDLTPAQTELLLGGLKRGGRVTAVGDSKQAIYAFRGAAGDAMQKMTTRLHAKTLPLSVCYRCASSIVRYAQQWVPDLEVAPNAEPGELVRDVTAARMIRDAEPGDFILSRVNAPLMGLCLGFLKEGRRAIVQGRDVGASLLSFVRRCGVAPNEENSVQKFLDIVDDWLASERARCMRMDPPGDPQPAEDRAACFHAVAEGAKSLAEIDARITRLFDDADKDASRIVLSTAHKAKGLERNRAWMLTNTFRPQRGGQELNINYVAATRAKRSLFLVTEVP